MSVCGFSKRFIYNRHFLEPLTNIEINNFDHTKQNLLVERRDLTSEDMWLWRRGCL